MNNVLVKADYSGQELRVLAEVSKDANMVDAFNKNYDLHLYTANNIFSLKLPDVAFVASSKVHSEAIRKFKRERHQAKNGVNFPIIYGAFAKRISEDNGVSIAEAQRWLDEFFRLYPGVKRAIEKTKKELYDYGYVTTLMGRRRRFPYYRTATRWEKAKMERQAFNFKIQGFSADMMKTAAAKVIQVWPNVKIVLSVHDELVWEIAKEKAEMFATDVKYIMEHCVVLSVPIIVDVSIVSNYGD